MIVQCTNCRARFRVADEKVPERGVKVRCTKCTTVFRVTKADAVDAKPAGSRDPFGLHTGPVTASHETSPGPGGRGASEFGESTGPLSPRTGPQTRDARPSGAAPKLANLPQPVSLTYGAASPHQTLDLELSLGPPSSTQATIPAMPAPPLAAKRPTPPPPAPAPMSSNAIDAALSAALAAPDPFATNDFGMAAAPPNRGYQAPAPVDPFAELSQPPPAYPPAPPAYVPPAPPPQQTIAFDDPFAVDFGGAQPPPPPPTPQTRHAPAIADPFGAMAEAPSPRYPPTPQVPTPGPARPPAAPPPNDPWQNLLNSPPKEETDPFLGLDAAPGMPTREPTAPPREPTAPPPPPERTGAPSDSSGLKATAVGEFEFGEATRGHKLDLDYGPSGEPSFETREPPKPKKEAPKESVELGRIQLGKVADDASPPERTKTPDPKAQARSRLRRELASAIFNVACACVVLYSGIIAVAWLRAPRPIGFNDLGFPMVWLALGAGGEDPGEQLRAADVKTGIYPTRGGGELFYVEGTVINGSAAKHDAMYASVEIVRGDRLVGRAEALAQLKATPEHLWELDSKKNEDLQQTLAKSTPPLEVDSRRSAPFVAVFKLTAKDVEGADVRVTVHPGVPASLRPIVSATPKAPTAPEAPAPENAPEKAPEGAQAQKP